MKTILAHLEMSSLLDCTLEVAHMAATMFDSYIEGLHLRPGQPDVIAAGADGFVAAAPDLVAGFEREAKERVDKARAIFEAFVERHGLPRPGSGRVGLSADWRIETAGGNLTIGSIGRVFDLIVLARPLKETITPSMAALETALFESGRPLLIAPPKTPTSLGRRIVVSWNRSSETARTVSAIMPFLLRAEKVTVLTVDRATVPGPSAAEMSLNLRRHGIDCDWREVAAAHRGPGQAILEETRKLGADLLVKGAYTNSRLRQMIFGGATSHILAEAELPVLMAH